MKHRYTICPALRTITAYRSEGEREMTKVMTLDVKDNDIDRDELGRIVCLVLDDLADRDARLPGYEVSGVVLGIVPPVA